jgi:hypothetical protein
MADALLWIVGILVVGFIVWNWLIVPGIGRAFTNINQEFQRNPKLVTDLKQFNTDLKHPPPPVHHPQANYGYYYY